MGNWKRPLGSLSLFVYLATWGTLHLVVLPLTLYDGTWSIVEYFSFLIVTSFLALIPTVFLNLLSGEVADSAHKRYEEPIDKVLPRIEGALTAKGVPFAKRRPPKRTTMRIRVDEFLDLNQGQVTIGLAPANEATMVYLGPVVLGNAVVIERLKDLIDGAVG